MARPHYIVATFLKEPLRIWISLLPKFPFLWKLTQSKQGRQNQGGGAGEQGGFPPPQIFAEFDTKPVLPKRPVCPHRICSPSPDTALAGLCNAMYSQMQFLQNRKRTEIVGMYNNLMPSPSIGPKWFWTIQIVLDGYKLFWSGPNCFGQVQIILGRRSWPRYIVTTE